MKTLEGFFGSGGVLGGVLVVCVVGMWSLGGLAQSDPWLGTWTLNVAKSKYNPGPPPQRLTVIYEAAKGIKVTVKGVDGEGKPMNWEYVGNDDGEDFPVTGNPVFDTMSMKRVDPYTVEFTRKKAGKVVQTGTNVVAKDGKTRTVTTKGINQKGEKIDNVAVFEKQ